MAPGRDWRAPRYFQYGCYWDHSGGVATDLFFHQLAFLAKVMGVGMPRQVVAAIGLDCFDEDSKTPHGSPTTARTPTSSTGSSATPAARG